MKLISRSPVDRLNHIMVLYVKNIQTSEAVFITQSLDNSMRFGSLCKNIVKIV